MGVLGINSGCFCPVELKSAVKGLKIWVWNQVFNSEMWNNEIRHLNQIESYLLMTVNSGMLQRIKQMAQH